MTERDTKIFNGVYTIHSASQNRFHVTSGPFAWRERLRPQKGRHDEQAYTGTD